MVWFSDLRGKNVVKMSSSSRSSGRTRKQPYIIFCQERAQLDPDLKGMKLPELVSRCSDAWKALEYSQRQK